MKLGNIAKAGTFALLLGGCAGEIIGNYIADYARAII